jgi:hypothetical protein
VAFEGGRGVRGGGVRQEACNSAVLVPSACLFDTTFVDSSKLKPHCMQLVTCSLQFTYGDAAMQLAKGYVVFRQNVDTGEQTVLAEIPMRTPLSPAWVHDFPVSQNYAIVPETPCVYNLKVRGLA